MENTEKTKTEMLTAAEMGEPTGGSEQAYTKIQTYLDNIFASIPPTDEALRLKNDMYCSMLDKYNGYVQEGANGNEAFGRVVGEFGSLDEIRAALALDTTVAPTAERSQVGITPERKKQYDKFKIGQAVAVACGVVLCIMSVFGYPLYSDYLTGMEVKEPENFVFGLLIAAGVFLFVWAGTGEAKFYDITQPQAFRPGVSEERMAAYRKFLSVRQMLISLAVALFVVSPFTYVFHFGMVIMPTLVAVGVAILIVVGAVHGIYSDVRTDK